MPSFVKNYRDKEKCRITRNRQRQRNYAKTAIYEPKEWTLKEDALVLEHSMTDTEMSMKLERSVQSIQTRRCKLKKGSAE